MQLDRNLKWGTQLARRARPTSNILTNRDMLHRDEVFFPEESSGVFDSHSGAPGRGVFWADNVVCHLSVT